MLTGRRYGGSAPISSPSSKMRPASGVSKPASNRSSVVLPQPEGPSSAKNSLRPISSEKSSTAACVPKCLLTPSNRTSGLPCETGSSAIVSARLKQQARTAIASGAAFAQQRYGGNQSQTGSKGSTRFRLLDFTLRGLGP